MEEKCRSTRKSMLKLISISTWNIRDRVISLTYGIWANNPSSFNPAEKLANMNFKASGSKAVGMLNVVSYKLLIKRLPRILHLFQDQIVDSAPVVRYISGGR